MTILYSSGAAAKGRDSSPAAEDEQGGLPSWMTSRGHCGRVCERISVCVLVNYSKYTLALFYCTLIHVVIPRCYDSPMDL